MKNKTVLKTVKNRVCLLTLNQPDNLNAMNDDMARDFKSAMEALKTDTETRVVVITGAGRAFSAGGNLKKLSESIGTDPVARSKTGYAFYNIFLSIRDLEIPTIAAINGHAVGAGACLAMACDMRLAADNAKIGFTFAKIGLHPGMGAEYFLTRAVGLARTFELLMTGDIIDAGEADHIGLVNHVVPAEKLLPEAIRLAEKIAAMPVLPIRMLKETIPAAAKNDLSEVLHRQAAYQSLCFMTGDFREGIDALIEKRKPDFKDER